MIETSAQPQPNGAPMRFPLKRFFGLFLFLTIGSLVGIFLYTGDSNFLPQALARIWSQPGVVLLIVVLLLLEWFTDYLRYYSLARGLGMELPLGFGLKLVFANLFFAYLTPGGAFGAPVVIYMLVKRKESTAHAIAVALIKPFLLFFVLLLGGSYLFWFADFKLSPATQHVLWTSSIFIAVMMLFVAMVIFLPHTARAASDFVLDGIRNWRNRRGHDQTPRLDRIQNGLHATITSFSLFGTARVRYLVYSLLATVANLVIFLGISVVLLQALGFPISQRTSWLYSFLYYFLIAFAPTPGGSGLAEGGGYLFFKHLGPLPLVSSYVVLWRFLSCYLVIFIGGALLFQFIQQVRYQELQELKTPTPPPAPSTQGDKFHE